MEAIDTLINRIAPYVSAGPAVTDWILFILAVVLLWAPYPPLTNRLRLGSLLARYTQPEIGRVLAYQPNYIDLLRAVAALFVLRELLARWPDGVGAHTTLQPGPVLMAVVALGALLQTVRMPLPLTIMGPIFYMTGVTLLLPGWLEGAFAVAFGWAFTFGTKDLRFQLPAMGVALGLAGFFNDNLTPLLLLTAGLNLAPTVFGLFLDSRIIFAARESRPERSTVRAPAARNGAPKLTAGQLTALKLDSTRSS